MTHSLIPSILHATHKLVLRNVFVHSTSRFEHLPLLRAHRFIDLILLLVSLFISTFLILRIFSARSWRVLVLLSGLLSRCFSQSKHVSETELADTVSIWDLALSLAQLTPSVKFYKSYTLISYHLECCFNLIVGTCPRIQSMPFQN